MIDPQVVESFHAAIRGNLSPLLIFSSDNDSDKIITTFIAAMVETVAEVLGRTRPKKKP